MNQHLNKLQPYPFAKLNALTADITPNPDKSAISLSIGEPRHASPVFVGQAITDNLQMLSRYPNTRGLPELREAIAQWLSQRFGLSLSAKLAEEQVLPVSGTREALFSVAQCLIDNSKPALVAMPNPFYQIYEGAALLAGAEPLFLNCNERNNFMPQLGAISAEQWRAIQLFYICTPGNPSGAVMDKQFLRELIALADRHDFVIVSDECYSEIYPGDAAPYGLLQVCQEIGRDDYARCLVMHSLSKRSNLPGLRSGFVAGDAKLISQYFQYRTYHGATMPLYSQMASIQAWQDEEHVRENRRLYQQKFEQVLAVLNPVWPQQQPDAGFYLWPETPIDDQQFTQGLLEQENVLVLPGSFLARDTKRGNPGRNRVRMALVAEPEQCAEAATRIARYISSL
jgi:N-succinyldiaminopimelate aminotransferase